MQKELFILKAACLFHDPPTKAWDLAKRKSHEERAEEIAKKILGGVYLAMQRSRIKDVKVKQADHLAAGVDRWLLSKLVGEDYGRFRCEEVKIKNIFNPKFEYIVKEPYKKQVDEFARKLNNILRHIQNANLAYHVLYACYEAYWINSGLPAGPADTRAPSHNVFDHNYATASIMNWLMEGKGPKGILLYIDLGGPQRFISSSRKLIDLWISSYFASVLAWKLFWIFIRSLGPDIMILPTCRGNPFYYHSLISELQSANVNENVIDEIKKLTKEVIGYDPDEYPMPRYAVVPVTATLILPDTNILREFDTFRSIKNLDDIGKFVEEKYREIWKEVYSGVIEECRNLKDNLGKFGAEAATLLEKCRDYGFDKTPPLPIRVLPIHINELYNVGFPHNEEEWYKLYHHMFKLLAYRESKEKIYKFRPEEELKLYDMTQDLASGSLGSWPEKSRRGFDYCSVCGRLPAIVIMPSDEKGFERHGLDVKLEPIFSFGERLCPYCLIKRLLGLHEVLENMIEKLLGKISRRKLVRKFLSVSDIAVLPFKYSFITAVKKLDQAPEELKDQFSKLMEEVWGKVDQIIKKNGIELKDIIRKEEPISSKERELLRIIEGMKSEKIKQHLKRLLFLDAEVGILGKLELRRIWREFLEDLKRKKEYERIRLYMDVEGIELPNTYYAVIRSDADNFGKTIQGNVEKGFRVNIKDYICNLLEGKAKKVIEAIMEGRLDDAKRLCEQEKISDIDRKLGELKELVNMLEKEKEIIISPSYHSALSKALVRNALRDVKVIDEYGGLPIYAGGDDLLAVMPVKNCLRAVRKLRVSFSFPLENPRGFDTVKQYFIPSLVTASRSFSVYLAHYMFPMYTIISRSAELLDDYAKEAEWFLFGNKDEKREKDALIFSYSPRGGEQNALLPLNSIKIPDKELASDIEGLQKLIDLIETPKGKVSFSSSLIYDLHNLKLDEHLLYACKRKNNFLLRKELENILYRNCEVRGENREKAEEIKGKKAKKWADKFVENYDLMFKVREKEGKEHPFLKEFVTGLMIYRSGLREVV